MLVKKRTNEFNKPKGIYREGYGQNIWQVHHFIETQLYLPREGFYSKLYNVVGFFFFLEKSVFQVDDPECAVYHHENH